MTVLIVDDETYMVDYLKTIVDWNVYGFDQVLTAGGGSLAKDMIIKYQPELLITDIMMPKISGIDLSKLIDENGYSTKVIIISGYSDFEYTKQAFRYQVAEYLVKPVVKEEFVETLERILNREFGAEEKGPRASAGDRMDPVISIQEYINEHYAEELSLTLLGEIANLHPVYLARIFKETTGDTPSAYIIAVRMEKAAQLLCESNMRIYEIMEMVGYKKQQYFTRLFKEKYGMTPKEYRAFMR